MGSFNQGFLSGVALSGVISALYLGYTYRQQHTENYMARVHARTAPLQTSADEYLDKDHSVYSDKNVVFDYKEKIKVTTKESYIQRAGEILKHGVPNTSPGLRFYSNHVLQYDQAKKIPLWVAEHITRNHVKGSANRKHSKFKPDPNIPPDFSATNSDYWDSGWSRGHMAPAGNNKHDQDAMDHTFYLSNVLPQDIHNNGGFWNRFEIYCRDLTKKYSNVWIVSGPVMMSSKDEDGNRFVQYQVIGDSEVAVPTHLYKVVTVGDSTDKSPAIAAFIVPNAPLSYDYTLKQFQVPLHYLETKTGIQFISKVDPSQTEDLCTVDGCQLMDEEQYELFIIAGKLRGARTLHRLEKVWMELESKGLKADKNTQDIYNAKLKELS